MRLSDFKGEKVFDVMSELLDPVAEILSDSQLATEYKSKPKIVVAQYILKHHKDETIKILAILADKSVDDYLAGVNIISLTKDVLELLGDEQLMVFLQAQRKSEDESSSSLPAANIVELNQRNSSLIISRHMSIESNGEEYMRCTSQNALD